MKKSVQNIDHIPICERLKVFRNKLGFKTAQAFAEHLGISYTTYHGYERSRIPQSDFLYLLAQKYPHDMDMVWLMTGKSVAKPYPGDTDPDSSVLEPTPAYYETENDILVKKTREILDSHTDYAQSLAANINSFHNAIQTQKDLVDLKKDNAELKKDFAEIKAHNMELSKSIERIERSARLRSQNDVDGDVQGGSG